jgi:hypothetical protein
VSAAGGAIRLNPRVVYREIGDGGRGVLLNLETGAYFSLNRLGCAIWKLAEGGTPIDRLLVAVRTEFDAAPDGLESDVRAFLGDLRERGLLSF